MNEWANFIAYGGSPEKRDKERKRKRDRYANDEDHREKVKAKAKARYGAKRKNQIKRLRKARGRNKPKAWMCPKGKHILLMGLGATADACNLSKKTFLSYEEREVIPINRVIDEQGRRWYPREFVEFLKPLLEKQSIRREPLWKLTRRVEQAWNKEKLSIPLIKEKTHAHQDRGSQGDQGHHLCANHDSGDSDREDR